MIIRCFVKTLKNFYDLIYLYRNRSEKENASIIVKDLLKMTRNTWIFTNAYTGDFNAAIGEAIKDIQETHNLIENEE